MKTDKRRFSPKELVEMLPITGQPLGGLTWHDFDLSITIYHEQKTTFVAEHWENGPIRRMHKTAGTPFPKQNARINVTASEWDKPIVYFPADFNEFLIDFQWSSSMNQQFFRLSNLRVRFDEQDKLTSNRDGQQQSTMDIPNTRA